MNAIFSYFHSLPGVALGSPFLSLENLRECLRRGGTLSPNDAWSFCVDLPLTRDHLQAYQQLFSRLLYRLRDRSMVNRLASMHQEIQFSPHQMWSDGLIEAAKQSFHEGDRATLKEYAVRFALLRELLRVPEGDYSKESLLHKLETMDGIVQRAMQRPLLQIMRGDLATWLRKLLPKHVPSKLFGPLLEVVYSEITRRYERSLFTGCCGWFLTRELPEEIFEELSLPVFGIQKRGELLLIGVSPKYDAFSGEEYFNCPAKYFEQTSWELFIRDDGAISCTCSSIVNVYENSHAIQVPERIIQLRNAESLYVCRPAGYCSLAMMLREHGPQWPMRALLSVAQKSWVLQESWPHYRSFSSLSILVAKQGEDSYAVQLEEIPLLYAPSGERGRLVEPSPRHAWILWLSELLFFDVKKMPASISWEEEALLRLDSFLPELLMNEVRALHAEKNGFGSDFSSALIAFVQERLKERKIDGFAQMLLEEFAYKMLLFPWLSSQLQQVIAGGEVSPFIEDELRSVQEEYRLLQESRASSPTTTIDLPSMQWVTSQFWPSEAQPKAIAISRIVVSALQKDAHVGRARRFHQGEFQGVDQVPASFRVSPTFNGVELEMLSCPSLLLGAGSYRKVKQAWQLTFEGADAQITATRPIALYRSKGNYEDSQCRNAYKMHERLLQIPGADAYFMPLSQRHSGYEVPGKVKWEGNMLLCEGSFADLFGNNKIGSTVISWSDMLFILRRVGEGLELIAREGISHGDLKPDNVLLQVVNGKVNPLISDYDWTLPFGVYKTPHDYYLWDRDRRERGIVSEKTDLYAWTLLVARLLCAGLNPYNEGDTLLFLERIRNTPIGVEEELRGRLVNTLRSRIPGFPQINRFDFFKKAGVDCRLQNEQVASLINEVRNRRLLGGDKNEASSVERFIIKSQWMSEGMNLLVRTLRADAPLKEKKGTFPTYPEIFLVLERAEKMLEEMRAQFSLPKR
ncbi:MAG: protein kinase family protein [Verrucomicrobiota bacterium]|nr:protein kinase family protein [Verrucomicrobiota bacterium]